MLVNCGAAATGACEADGRRLRGPGVGLTASSVLAGL